MSVRVLVSREFECVTVAEAASQFKSLADTGWSVFVKADDASGPPPSPSPSPSPSLSRDDAARIVQEIVQATKASTESIADAVGVCGQSVRNWRRGLCYPTGQSWSRLKSLYESVKAGSRELRKASRLRKRRAARALSQDDLLDIGIRVSSGESIQSVANAYEVSRHRVKSIARKVGA